MLQHLRGIPPNDGHACKVCLIFWFIRNTFLSLKLPQQLLYNFREDQASVAMTTRTKTMWMRARKTLTHRTNRNSCGLVMVLLTFGTVIFRWSFPEQSTSLQFDTMQAELDSNDNSKTMAPKSSIEQDTKSTKVFQMPPPISYFKHGNNGLDASSYCIHNSNSDSCCSEEHCATIVKRSTLYSECCGHVHDNNTVSRSKIFPLLITSAPRSGTWFMQQLMTKTGLQGLTTDNYSPTDMGTVSWKHIFHQDNNNYFGRQSTTRLYNSKFRVIWHLVRDPLKTLTSIAFTDPLWEDSEHSRIYIEYISSHIPISNKTMLMTRFNISDQDLEGVMQHRTIAMNRNIKLSQFLIYRGLEIYLYWHGFINYLNVPVFRLEDLAADKNLTILDEMFRSVGYGPPNHAKVLQVLDAQEAKRNAQHRRRLAELRQLQSGYQGNTRGHRIRKGSRIHRDTLTWKEICAVSLTKAHALLKMSHSFGYYTDVGEEGLCT